MTSIIAAVADNGAIGKGNALLWHIKEDMKYFRKVTMGCPVIMGRRTFESLGRPLPGRLNIVVSRSLQENAGRLSAAGVCVASSLEEAVSLAGKGLPGDMAARTDGTADPHHKGEIFIIGGGEIYRQAVPLADMMYITEVHTEVDDADTFFPRIDAGEWEEVSRSEMHIDHTCGLGYEFVTYSRKTD